jgi:hypothetical protein
VVVVNRRVECTPYLRGAHLPREVTRHGTRGTNTHGWSRTDHETRASAGRDKPSERVVYKYLSVEPVPYTAWLPYKLPEYNIEHSILLRCDFHGNRTEAIVAEHMALCQCSLVLQS